MKTKRQNHINNEKTIHKLKKTQNITKNSIPYKSGKTIKQTSENHINNDNNHTQNKYIYIYIKISTTTKTNSV